VKRTDLEGLGESAAERLRKEEEDGIRGRGSLARAKSADRAWSLGCVIEETDLVGKPRNWDVRSSNCCRNRDDCESAPLSDSVSCFSKASMPSRIESSDRDMWPSWEFGSRLRLMARCRSSRDSLMWSARR